jgi:radical SAM protein with 4Fe4S-binding SPASM domain
MEDFNIHNIGLYVNKVCDHRCGYCLLNTVPPMEPEIMSLEVAVESVTKLISEKAKKIEIEFFGGEPLCSIIRIFEITNHLKEHFKIPIEFSLWTNAAKFKVEYWDYFKNNNFYFFINGYLEEQELNHETQPIQLKNLLKNRGKGLKNGLRDDPNRFSLIWLVQSSKQDLKEIAISASSLGFSKIYFLPERDKLNQLKWNQNDYKNILERYRSLILWYLSIQQRPSITVEPLESIIKDINKPDKALRCNLCDTSLVISTSGLVCPCYTVIGEGKFCLGHYKDSTGIRNQLTNLKNIAFSVPQFCQECILLNICGGVCIYEKLVAIKNNQKLIQPNDCELQIFLISTLMNILNHNYE